MKQNQKTNETLKSLLVELKKASISQKNNLWKRVADDLEKSTSKRRVVNLSKLNRYTKENETVVIPGKVLGSGELNHKLTVAAFAFSNSAIEEIKKKGGSVLQLSELLKEDPKGKKIRIMG